MTNAQVAQVQAAPEASRFASFIVTGGIAAGVNVLSRAALSQALPYEVAVAVAYLFGMTTAFLLARRFVFAESGRPWWSEYGRFALVNVASFVQVWLVSVLLARVLFPYIGFDWHAEDVAHVIGVASPIVLSYYLHKHFSFKSK
jgi:putative flippase GtrA